MGSDRKGDGSGRMGNWCLNQLLFIDLIPQWASTLPGEPSALPCLQVSARRHLSRISQAQPWYTALQKSSQEVAGQGQTQQGPRGSSRGNWGGPGERRQGQREHRAGEDAGETLESAVTSDMKRLACGTGDRGESFWLRFSEEIICLWDWGLPWGELIFGKGVGRCGAR